MNKREKQKALEAALDLVASLTENSNEITFAELAERVLNEHWNQERFIKSNRYEGVKWILKKYLLPTFGDKKLSQITLTHVRTWFRSNQSIPIAANEALGVLSIILNYAEEYELKRLGSNPCRFITPYPKRKRKRFASPEELTKLFNVLEREFENNPQAVTFLYLLLYTGARPSSIERGKWDDIKRFNHNGQVFGRLTFEGKSTNDTGEMDEVIFPPQAIEILDRFAPKRKRFFNAPLTICQVKIPKTFWNKIREELGFPDLWLRDLRRTFATVGLSNGEHIGVIGELLNHKTVETTKIYAKVFEETKVNSVGRIADQLGKLK